jgi:hypothetical protein
MLPNEKYVPRDRPMCGECGHPIAAHKHNSLPYDMVEYHADECVVVIGDEPCGCVIDTYAVEPKE